MTEREEKLEKRKPTSTVTSLGVVPKKTKIVENTKEEIKLDKKEGDIKVEEKSETEPSVVIDNRKGLDVHVPIGPGNMVHA